jgi:hypothetical protein
MHCIWSIPLTLLQITNLNYGITHTTSYSYFHTSKLSFQYNVLRHYQLSFFPSAAQQPNSGPGRLILQVSRSHIITDKHTHKQTNSVRLLYTSDQPSQRPIPTQHTPNRRDKHPCSRCDSNPRFQRSRGRRPTPLTARPPGPTANTHLPL